MLALPSKSRLPPFHGLHHIFGITTTYEKWRFCWFPESDACAASADIDFIAKQQNQNLQQIPEELHGTEVFSYNHPDIPKLLTSIIYKMYKSPWSNSTKIHNDPSRPVIVLTPDQWQWKKSPLPEILSYDKVPNSNNTRFLLLQDLGQGADGHVWLATSESGCVCVLKFPKGSFGATSTKLDAQIEAEHKNWIEAQPWIANKIRIVSLLQKKVLMMPFVTLFKEKPHESFVLEKVKSAIGVLAKNGIVHEDLRWRHVGTYQDEIVFIDLARLRTKVDAKEATDAMLNSLGL